MFLNLNQKYNIAERVKELITVKDGTQTYQDGWSDYRVASQFGVKPAQVRYIRKQIFPNMTPKIGSTGRPSQYKKLIQEQGEALKVQGDTITSLEKRVGLLETLFRSNRAA